MTIATAPSSGAALKAPFPVLLLLVLVILVPIEFSFRAGGLFITASKLFLIIWAFIILPKIAEIKLRIYDWFFIAHVFWVAMCLMMSHGSSGIERAGTFILEFFVVYLTVRVYMKSVSQFRGLIIALCVMAGVAAILAFPEAITHKRYIHDFFRQITGIYYRIDYSARLGILRAASLFEHPILFGIFCASLVSFAWFSGTIKNRFIRIPMLGFGTFLSASSAPLLIFLLQIWLIVLEKVSRPMKKRVLILGGIAVVLTLILELGTGRGVVGTIALITLSSGTTYIRRTIWQHGIDDVMRNPFFGFDETTWTRPSWLAGSVDNNWLLLMMRGGIPSLILLALAILFIWIALAKRTETDEQFRGLRIGWGLTMITLLLGGATVAFFGKLQPLFAFYIGFGAALANCYVPNGKAEPEPEPGRGIRYSRFVGKLAAKPRVQPAWAHTRSFDDPEPTARSTPQPEARAPAPPLSRFRGASET